MNTEQFKYLPLGREIERVLFHHSMNCQCDICYFQMKAIDKVWIEKGVKCLEDIWKAESKTD